MLRWLPVLCCSLVLAAAAGGASSPLTGVYRTTVKGQGAQLNGTWLISFAPTGAYTVVKEPNTRVRLIGGRSSVSGTTIVFADRTGPAACPASGKYSWSRTGKTLRLTKVKDACAGRVAVLASAPFTKVG